MKQLSIILAAFSFDSAALACPVKAEKISNGTLPMLSGLQAECGIVYKVYAAQAKQQSDNTLK